MKNRTVQQIFAAQKINMGGIHLLQALPNPVVKHIDPFLLIHHGSLPAAGHKDQKDAGVGPHPHRGFSPVTFVFKGEVQHQDSLGNNAIVGAGGTQWMHAGSGIVHSERPSKAMIEQGGENEIIQFWVNTPAEFKMHPPYYRALSAQQTPTIQKKKHQIQVVAGQYESKIGPAKTYSPQLLLRIDASKEAAVQLTIPKHYNTLIYLLNGSLQTVENQAKSGDMLWFKNDGDQIELTLKEDSRFIVLSGEPIGEPVATYGPFVMNKAHELQQAIADFQEGKMGQLKEQF
jgi:hypothetical protein